MPIELDALYSCATLLLSLKIEREKRTRLINNTYHKVQSILHGVTFSHSLAVELVRELGSQVGKADPRAHKATLHTTHYVYPYFKYLQACYV